MYCADNQCSTQTARQLTVFSKLARKIYFTTIYNYLSVRANNIDLYFSELLTIYGLLGGGYSGAPIAWTRLEPYAGYKIVERASLLLHKLWLTE